MTAWLAEAFWNASPSSLLDIEVWVEPFAGGAGAALTALSEHGVPEAWLVEANPAVAAFWLAATRDGGRLAARVEATTPTLAAFYAARERVATADGLPSDEAEVEELAFATFLVNRCSRSGLVVGNVGPIGGKAQSGRHTIASRFNGDALAARLRGITALGHRLRIHHGDGISHIEALAGSGVEDEVFLFVDPPYFDDGPRLYSSAMRASQHQRLADALHACPAPWALTYDAHPRVLDLYHGDRIQEFSIRHTANRAHADCEFVVLSECVPTPQFAPINNGVVRTVQPAEEGAVAASGCATPLLMTSSPRHLEGATW